LFINIITLGGPPATGKSQLSMQLCLSLQLPHSGYGDNVYAIFIDTEGFFF
jgi:RecA/RadA recombinase